MKDFLERVLTLEPVIIVTLSIGIYSIFAVIASILLIRKAKKNISVDYERRLSDLQDLRGAETSQYIAQYHDAQKSAEILQAQIEHLKSENTQLLIARTSLATKLEEREISFELQKKQMEDAKKAMKHEFEALANRLFNDKQEVFVKSARSNIEQLIMPFQGQLKDFYHRLESSQRSEQHQRSQLLGQLGELQKQSQKLSDDAYSLTQALKGNNKLMGSWGEMVLSRLLESAGLVQGREFDLQVAGSSEAGKRLLPDAVIHLPEGKDIVVDSKVSLLSYEKWVNAESDEEKINAEKRFSDSVKAHIKGLAAKQYGANFGVQSIEFVFLFVPIEQAFNLLVHNHQDLMEEAFSKQVVIAGPANLVVALKTIESLWQRDRQDKNIEKIVASAGKLHDQFVLFAESFSEIGLSIDKANDAYQKALDRLCDKRGNIIKRVEDLKDLGARATKAIPDGLLDKSRYSELGLEENRSEAHQLESEMPQEF